MCGASSQQTQIEASQQKYYDTMTQEAQQVFGESTSLFKDLTAAFEPILAAGPNQEGFSAAEKAALNTQATEGVAQNYQSAAKAIAEQQAAEGGGNEFVPSGQNAEIKAEVAMSAAQQESAEQTNITEADYATGRSNFLTAAQELSSAAGVFNPATGISGAATSSGEAASKTASDIATANNSWLNAAIGAVGGVAGAVGGAYAGK